MTKESIYIVNLTQPELGSPILKHHQLIDETRPASIALPTHPSIFLLGLWKESGINGRIALRSSSSF
ncbi:MAG: hypothetical protein QW756_08735 [Nitrososphaerota archaeon]